MLKTIKKKIVITSAGKSLWKKITELLIIFSIHENGMRKYGGFSASVL